MDSHTRRNNILNTLQQEISPISASTLGIKLNVSRQVIVGDVSLLRAKGYEIIATPKGYVMPQFKQINQYVGKVNCKHDYKDTIYELYTIVDLEAIVVDVIVNHQLYGEIIGYLNLSKRKDVDAFISKAEASNIKLLSELTMGDHIHTIACNNHTHFEQVCEALKNKGFLVES